MGQATTLPARAALLLAVWTAACQIPPAGADRDSGPPPLVVASDLDNMPFAGVDDEGRPVGRDVEMMEAIARSLGRPLRWERIPFDTLLPAAKSGLVDVVCATLGVTPERSQHVSFSTPYFETSIEVVVRSGAGEPQGWDDLAGKRVAAGAGTTAERAVRRQLPFAEGVFGAKSELAPAERLLVGEVDGIAMDGPAAAALVERGGGALTLLHTPLAPERYALAVPKDRRELLGRINAALAELESSGQMRRWDVRHGLKPVAVGEGR